MYRLGFIGGGINSAIGETHKIAAEMDSLFEVSCGCFSRNEIINKQSARRWNIDRIYDDINELLKKEKNNLDAICILTPPATHSEIILQSLNMDYPIICEKALTDSVRNAKKINEKSLEKNGFLATIYNYTGYPMLRELKEMIRNGLLGKIINIQIEMPQHGFIRSRKESNKPQNWRLKDGLIPTISLDLGVHLHHLIHFLTHEKITEVYGSYAKFGQFKDVVDDVNIIGETTGGARVNLWYGKAALGCKNGLQIRIFGDKGSAKWYQLNPEELEIYDQYGVKKTIDRDNPNLSVANLKRYNRFKVGHPAGFIEAFSNYYFDIYEALDSYLKEKKYSDHYIDSCRISLEGLQFLEAVSKSVLSGKRERVYYE